jgi:hypothetical protein
VTENKIAPQVVAVYPDLLLPSIVVCVRVSFLLDAPAPLPDAADVSSLEMPPEQFDASYPLLLFPRNKTKMQLKLSSSYLLHDSVGSDESFRYNERRESSTILYSQCAVPMPTVGRVY